VENIIDETEEFVKERLMAMDRELRNIPQKSAYEEAERMCVHYVTNRKFRLMFLRAVRFDAQQAAVRLVSLMERKLEYFGVAALARPLRLSDLDKDELTVLKSGKVQLLPSRDSAGRAVVGNFQVSNSLPYKHASTFVGVISWPSRERNSNRFLIPFRYLLSWTGESILLLSS
jgi:hypothetical protein